MKCEEARRDILLADTGELSARKADRVRQHLAACPTCAAFWQELSQIRTVLHDHPAPAPSPTLIHRILEKARQAVPARPLPCAFWQSWAAAAVFFIAIAGGWWAWRATQAMHQHADPPRGVAELGGLLLATLADAQATDWRAEKEDDALGYVARGLLIWQGLGIEEDWGIGTAEEVTESEVPTPTTLRWRNTPEPDAERRV